MPEPCAGGAPPTPHWLVRVQQDKAFWEAARGDANPQPAVAEAVAVLLLLSLAEARRPQVLHEIRRVHNDDADLLATCAARLPAVLRQP